MPQTFDPEKLDVYRFALGFYTWSEPVIARVPKSSPLHDQLDRARTSIFLNIAEGNGKYTAKDRCRLFDISRGSTLECAACLDLMHFKNFLNDKEMATGKETLKRIVSMLIGLIKSNSGDRLYEDSPVCAANACD